MTVVHAPLGALIILEDSSLNPLGGGQKVTLQVTEALHDSCRIHLFDYCEDSAFLMRARPFAHIAPRLPRTFSIFLNSRAISAMSAFYDLRTAARLILTYSSKEGLEKPIVLYATTTKTLAIAWWLSLVAGFKYVFHAHLVQSRISPFRWFLEFSFRRAAFILCVSKSVQECLPGRRYLLYNGIKINPGRTPLPSPRKFIVAMFSTLSKFKGVRYFMESYEFLRHAGQVEYRVYGQGKEQKKLRRLENEHVRLMGFTEKVPDILANEISLVAIPSLIAEACPMVLLEALSFGIPVIGTNKGGLAELLKDGEVGFQVPPRDPAAIAAKIDYLIEHPDVYVRFSANALEYVKQFDIEKYRETVRGLFRDLRP